MESNAADSTGRIGQLRKARERIGIPRIGSNGMRATAMLRIGSAVKERSVQHRIG